MAKLFANSGEPDQMPHSTASDLGLHCLPLTLLLVSRLQWVNRLKGFSSKVHGYTCIFRICLQADQGLVILLCFQSWNGH